MVPLLCLKTLAHNPLQTLKQKVLAVSTAVFLPAHYWSSCNDVHRHHLLTPLYQYSPGVNMAVIGNSHGPIYLDVDLVNNPRVFVGITLRVNRLVEFRVVR